LPQVHRKAFPDEPGHTIAAANNNPGVFGYIGVFSGGGRIDETFDKQLAALKASGVKYYWLGAGDTDMAHAGTVALADEVKKVGFETSYHEMKGIHYWFIWRQFLSDLAPVLFVGNEPIFCVPSRPKARGKW
jgi:S-formylglutathione hydrolase FrmB